MKRIGILRGGVSPEYHFSLQTGANVQRALADAGFEAIDMLLDKDGVLHIKGVPADLEKVQSSVDTVWNALHGEFGEDGQVQRILESYGIPYTGSGTLASALTFNKQMAKDTAKKLGLHTPQSLIMIPDGTESVSEITARIYKTMAPPWVVKPLSGGGSVHAYFAFTPLELSQFVDDSVVHGTPFIVEQYIEGREAAVGVVNDFRTESEYVLPVMEVHSPKRNILSNNMRTSEEMYTVPTGSFTIDERRELSDLAKKLHNTFDARDYSQSEFIVDNRGKIWFIEIDTQPHLTKNAPFLGALDAVGSSLQEFVQSTLKNK